MKLSLRKTLPLFLLLCVLASLCLAPTAYAAGTKRYYPGSAEELEAAVAEANDYCQGGAGRQAFVFVSGNFENEPGDEHLISLTPGVTMVIDSNSDVRVHDLEVQEGAAVELDPGAVFMVYNSLALDGTVTVGDENDSAEFHIPVYGLGQVPYDNIIVPTENQELYPFVVVHFHPGDADTLSDMLDEANGMGWPYQGNIQVNFDWTLSNRTLEINGSASVEVNEGGSLSIGSGGVLVVNNWLQANGAEISLKRGGILENNANITLNADGSVNVGRGAYTGYGRIYVIYNTEDPDDLVLIDGLTRIDRENETIYYNADGIWEQFTAACENHEDYFDLRELSRFTIQESVCIPEEMYVETWGTEIVVPEGVDLLVHGHLDAGALTLAGGSVTEENNGFVYTNALTIDGGDIWLNDYTELHASYWDSQGCVGSEHIHFVGENNRVRLNGVATDDGEFETLWNDFKNLPDGFFGSIAVWYDMIMDLGLDAVDGKPVQINIEGENGGSLTINSGAVLNADYLSVRSATLTVHGKLISNDEVKLEAAWERPVGTLVCDGDECYESNPGGRIVVCNTEDPDAQIHGLSLDRFFITDIGYGIAYFETGALFEEFEEACNNRYSGLYDLRNRGGMVVLRDVSIPLGMQVEAWGTEIVVPEGVTLTVGGNLNTHRLHIDGTVTLENWGFIYSSQVELGETGQLNVTGNNYMYTSYYESESIIGNDRVHFAPGNYIHFAADVHSVEEFYETLDMLKAIPAEHDGFIGRLRVCESMTLDDDADLHGGKPVVLEVSDGATLTISQGTTLNADMISIHGSTMEVHGKVIGNGNIRIENDNGRLGELLFDNDACFVSGGDASIFVGRSGEGLAQLQGLNLDRFSVVDRSEGVYFIDNSGLFEKLKTACLSGETYFDMRNKGTFELTESLTIPAGMTVDARGTTFVVPVGNRATVEGVLVLSGWNLNGMPGSITIPEGGELHITSWSGIAGKIWTAWVEDGSVNRVTFAEDAGVYVNFGINNDFEMGKRLELFRDLENEEHVRPTLAVLYDWTVSDAVVIPHGVDVQVEKSLTVSESGVLTVFGRMAAQPDVVMTIDGVLVVDNFVEMLERKTAQGPLMFVNGSVRGLGALGVKSLVDPDSYFSGLDLSLYDRHTDNIGNRYVRHRFDPDFVLPDGLIEIGEEAFAGDAFYFALLPPMNEVIASRAFADNPNLAFIFIPPATETIAEDAFDGTAGVTIFCVEGSTADHFAKTHGFPFRNVS